MAPKETPPRSASMAPNDAKAPAKPEPPKRPMGQVLFRDEAEARLQKPLPARVGFVERLVTFWSNHFAVSVAKSNELLDRPRGRAGKIRRPRPEGKSCTRDS